MGDASKMITTPAGMPSKDVERVAQYNGRLMKIVERQQAAERQLQALVTREDMTASQLIGEGERLQAELHDCRRDQLALMPERMEILQALRGSVAAMVEDARNQRQKTVERIERALSKAGHAPEQSRVYSVNPGAAEARFQYQIRESADVRAADSILEDAIGHERRLVQQIQQAATMLTECREQLHRLNHKLLRI